MKTIRFAGLEFEVNLSLSVERVKRIVVPLHSRGENEYVYHSGKLVKHEVFDLHINYVLNGNWKQIKLPYKCKRVVVVSIDPTYHPNTDNKGINDHRTMVIDLYK